VCIHPVTDKRALELRHLWNHCWRKNKPHHSDYAWFELDGDDAMDEFEMGVQLPVSKGMGAGVFLLLIRKIPMCPIPHRGLALTIPAIPSIIFMAYMFVVFKMIYCSLRIVCGMGQLGPNGIGQVARILKLRLVS
jgi:hypothetical protein